MRSIDCRISKVTLQNKDTLLIEIEKNQHFELSDFEELKDAARELGKGKKFYNLIKVGTLTIPDRLAREESCSVSGSIYKKADAFVIQSLPQKIIAGLMLKINQPVVPTKFFTCVNEAEKWLNKLKKKELEI